MKVYCPYCKKEVEYKIEKRELKEFRGIEVNTFENVAICNECNQDLYVNKIEDENNERIYKKNEKNNCHWKSRCWKKFIFQKVKKYYKITIISHRYAIS